jgi:hypothetical protein
MEIKNAFERESSYSETLFVVARFCLFVLRIDSAGSAGTKYESAE